jgi:Fic family protein
MKIEPAPDILSLLSQPPKEILEKIVLMSIGPEFQKIRRKANREYLYWDKFKYLDFPEGLTPRIAWLGLKISRISNARQIPGFVDLKGNLFRCWLPDRVLEYLHYIDQNSGGQVVLERPEIGKAERERYVVSSLMEEAIASSLIEGAATTRQIAKEMLRSGRNPKNKAEQMILNNYQTIRKIKDFLGEQVTPELLCRIQKSITKDTLDDPRTSGRFRTEQEQVRVMDEKDGMVLHTPPPVSKLQDRITHLCEFANEPGEEYIHPVVKAIILHFWLAYEHPFVDGNGRTARALFYWYMLKNDYWLFEYLSISRMFLRTYGQYKRSFLYSEIDQGDLTYFLIYNLRAIVLVIDEVKRYIREKQSKIKDTLLLARNYPSLNHRQRELLQHALTHPAATYTISYHKTFHSVVYQTARADLLGLYGLGLFEKMKRGRTFYFVPVRDMGLKLKQE